MAEIGALASGPSLALSDENRRPRAVLSVVKDGAGLAFNDASGRSRDGLTLTDNGPHLWLSDASGQNLFYAPVREAVQPAPAQGISPQAEYQQALAAYDAALKELNDVQRIGSLHDGLKSLAPETPAWGQMLGDWGKQSMMLDASRKLEIARLRLERAKARIDQSERPR